ncbi:MAG: hypothetical protein EBR30_10130 [Cytophagia bacterium]|nr:hypothetical protein [Cytophagia bacterium]
MRIKFKTIIRSTDKEPSILIEKILMELDKPGYQIFAQTPRMVIFTYNIWRFASRSEVFKRIDGGVFNIGSEKKIITFDFYVSPILEIILTLIAVFFGITEDYHIFLFFAVFIAIMFVIRLISMRNTAIQMMDDITGNDE